MTWDPMAGHEGHLLQQIGRCVYCADCDERLFQGRLPFGKTETTASHGLWQLRLHDGFVAYVGPKAEAEARATSYPGSTVEPRP